MAKQAKDALEELNKEIKKIMDSAYKATHDKFDVERKEALEKYQKSAGADGISGTAKGNRIALQAAHDDYTATMKKIRDEERASTRTQASEFIAANKTMNDYATEQAKKMHDLEEKRTRGFLQVKESLQKQAADYAQEQWIRAAEAISDKWNNAMDYVAKQTEDDISDMAHAAEQLADKWNQLMNGNPIVPKKQKVSKDQDPWHQMADDAKKTLVDGLGQALTHGFKGFFQSILQQWEQMLANMVAQAVISGIFGLFSGGLSGGASGFLGAFGFDDGANDASANRWGRDFGHLFQRGISEGAMRERGSQGYNGNGGNHTEIHITGDQHYHGEMDAVKVAKVIEGHIAFSTQRRLRSVVGS